jgi:hypothetical protein
MLVVLGAWSACQVIGLAVVGRDARPIFMTALALLVTSTVLLARVRSDILARPISA